MRRVLYALVVLGVLFVVALIAMWRLQERIVWQPPRLAAYPSGEARRVDYRSDDGQPLFAFVVGEPARAAGLIIAFHGNADLAVWTVPWAAEVQRRTGWAVMVAEYRGYGGLPGSPDYLSSQRDARATYRVAREQLGVDARHIALHGHSLGSAVAAELAVEHAPSVLILEAPFTSARDMARRMLAPVAAVWGVVARVHFDTRSKVAALDVPTWVVHGERDGVIPVRMGRAVHAAARVPGDLLLVRGAGHNDVRDVAGDAYWAWLRRALERATVARS
ncbi:MAG TPA: alpha/beta hydrolase [Gemmatimonadaceae bacterium]